MAKHAARRSACFAIFFGLLPLAMLGGCVARGPVMSAKATELERTPYFPQRKFQCGPAAMATVLGASGAATTADALTRALYIPARRGSLQVEMLATPRDFGRLALPLPRNPEAIVAELDAGRPVLVLHNYGLPFWPRWHYAVVIGYDPAADVFVLRSGTSPRQRMRTRRFMVAWHYGGRWSMVVLRPGETPALDDAKTFFEAAAAFEKNATPQDSRATFDAAVRRWPQEPIAYLGRGTAEYRLGNLPAAARDYAAALALDATQAAARNNLAQTLVDLRCPRRAFGWLAGVDIARSAPPLREALDHTLRSASAAAALADDGPACQSFP